MNLLVGETLDNFVCFMMQNIISNIFYIFYLADELYPFYWGAQNVQKVVGNRIIKVYSNIVQATWLGVRNIDNNTIFIKKPMEKKTKIPQMIAGNTK